MKHTARVEDINLWIYSFGKLEVKITHERIKFTSVRWDYISRILKMGYEEVGRMQHPKATVQGLAIVKWVI
jgi:hypothetical protein